MQLLKLYFAAFSSALQAKLEYRTDFILGVLTSTMLQLAALSFLMVVLGNAPSLGGWSTSQVLFLFGMTAMALGTSELLFNHIWLLPQYVITGDLDRLLTYPVHSLSFFLVCRPELHAFGNLFSGAVLVVVSLLRLDVAWYLWLLVPLWSACGTIIYTSVLVIFGTLSFKFIGPFSYHLLVPHSLLQATRYPLAIYPKPLQFALSVGIPFGAFHYFPASFMFAKESGVWRAGAPILAASLAALAAHAVWNWALRYYESTGS